MEAEKEIYTHRLYHISYNISSHSAFYYFTLYDLISVAIMVLQMPTKTAVFYGEEK